MRGPRRWRRSPSRPLTIRPTLLGADRARRSRFAEEGKPAGIWLKMNSLVDEQLIDALYRASQAGVKVDVRGARHLLPAPGRAGPVREHPRQVHRRPLPGAFAASASSATATACPSRRARVFISSADWMARNMDWRVETLVPVENPTVHAQILDQIMVVNLKDTAQSWELQPDGAWRRVTPGPQPGLGARVLHDQPLALRPRQRARRRPPAGVGPTRLRPDRVAQD